MKKWICILAIMMLALTASLAAAEGSRTVTVTGTATILTDADTASVNLGVVSVAKEAGEASRTNAAQVDRLIAALKEAGIAEKDITTAYYYVNTRRDYNAYTETGEYPIIGYEVNNSLTVRVRDLDQVGAIIDTALANGANSCDGVSFTAAGAAGDVRDEVLRAAIEEGKRRAAIMAEACGGTLGDVLSVKENYSTGGAVFNNKRTSTMGMAVEGAADAGTAIMSDGLSFSATVEMTFELR